MSSNITITISENLFGIDYSAMDQLGVPERYQTRVLEKANIAVGRSLETKRKAANLIRDWLVKKMPRLQGKVKIDHQYNQVSTTSSPPSLPRSRSEEAADIRSAVRFFLSSKTKKNLKVL